MKRKRTRRVCRKYRKVGGRRKCARYGVTKKLKKKRSGIPRQEKLTAAENRLLNIKYVSDRQGGYYLRGQRPYWQRNRDRDT